MSYGRFRAADLKATRVTDTSPMRTTLDWAMDRSWGILGGLSASEAFSRLAGRSIPKSTFVHLSTHTQAPITDGAVSLSASAWSRVRFVIVKFTAIQRLSLPKA